MQDQKYERRFYYRCKGFPPEKTASSSTEVCKRYPKAQFVGWRSLSTGQNAAGTLGFSVKISHVCCCCFWLGDTGCVCPKFQEKWAKNGSLWTKSRIDWCESLQLKPWFLSEYVGVSGQNLTTSSWVCLKILKIGYTPFSKAFQKWDVCEDPIFRHTHLGLVK